MLSDEIMRLVDEYAELEAQRSYMEDQGTRNEMAYDYPALQQQAIDARQKIEAALLEKQADELELLRRDAERYRALRCPIYQLHEDDISVSDSFFNSYFEEELDAAVDALIARSAAMKEKHHADR